MGVDKALRPFCTRIGENGTHLWTFAQDYKRCAAACVLSNVSQ